MPYVKETLSEEELKAAFKKLQGFSYFDNYDLLLRGKIARYKENIDENLKKFLLEVSKAEPFKELFANSIAISFLPKKVDSQPTNIPESFYTNARILGENIIEKPVVFCDLPIEFHLVSVVWLMRHGVQVENNLSKNAHGNRLIIDEEKQEIVEGRALFKPYFRQFQNWWSQAIGAAKNLLEKGEDATIINFDLQSFYHDVKFSFTSLEKEFPGVQDDVIHPILVKIHHEYAQILSRYNKKITTANQEYPLPIGLLSSHVLANWYLSKLDSFIDNKLRPVYYGRYVDDILIVIKDTVLGKDEIVNILNGNSNDNANKIDNNGGELIEYYLKEYLSDVLTIDHDAGDFKLKLPPYQNLKLNRDKLFIYQFDAKYSPNLVEN